MNRLEASRRALLRFLLGSPLALTARPLAALAELLEVSEVISAPDQAVNVFDFEPVAARNLLPAHYTYLSMGVQHEVTLAANRAGFERYRLRPRRLVDVRDLDTSTQVLGTELSTPIALAPLGAQRAFHADGELAVARAARARDHLMLLSTGSSVDLEEVVEARGAPLWFQLYTPGVWPVTRWLLRRAERAGCPAVALTVDIPGAGWNRDRIRALRRPDNPSCQGCHAGDSALEKTLRGAARAADVVGFDLDDWLRDFMVLDWDYLDRIRDATSMKLLVKGILTPEDAERCVEHGVDGIVVSNHGGRAEDSGLSTIGVLPAIVRAVGGRVPILIDSGFRRGTDVFKALALGASAVCVGRPYAWGLSAFGREGVEAVLAILRRELETTMMQMGTPALGAISGEHVVAAG